MRKTSSPWAGACPQRYPEFLKLLINCMEDLFCFFLNYYMIIHYAYLSTNYVKSYKVENKGGGCATLIG